MHEALLQTFRQMLDTQAGLRLLNVYKGVPIAHEASLIDVGPASILVKSSSYQIVCLYHERSTYLQSSNLPSILSARVYQLYSAELQAELTDFEEVPSGVGDRKQVRVKPEEMLKGGIFTSGMGEPLQAELADISREGLAIYIPRMSFYATEYRKGVKIKVKLRFPGEYEVQRRDYMDDSQGRDPLDRFSRDTLRSSSAGGSKRTTGTLSTHRVPYPPIEIQGQIANLREEPTNSRVRVGVQILPGDSSLPIIQAFISQRQAEIIREMQQVYNMIIGE
jgi:hypothetical protein